MVRCELESVSLLHGCEIEVAQSRSKVHPCLLEHRDRFSSYRMHHASLARTGPSQEPASSLAVSDQDGAEDQRLREP